MAQSRRHPQALRVQAMAIFSRDPKVAMLRNLPALAVLQRRRLISLTQVFDEVEVHRGAVISRPGDARVQFAVLGQGRAEVRGPDGDVEHIEPGDVLPDATVIAVEPSHVLVAHPRYLVPEIARMLAAPAGPGLESGP